MKKIGSRIEMSGECWERISCELGEKKQRMVEGEEVNLSYMYVTIHKIWVY
jgi:hypothetical protein